MISNLGSFDGEWIIAAWTGRTLIAIAFTSAILSAIAFIAGWKSMGRKAFLVHACSTFVVIALIFALFFGHRYEFQYIWKHLNNEMSMKFVLSAFWGGQEGGFLLWMFWHNILALFILKIADRWEPKVMAVLASIEAFLAMMLLGVWVGDFHLGLDPFLLMREVPSNIGLPWTGKSNYLTTLPFFFDGQGLNPLLQNYWMTIHPPTLFLGFASTTIPFSYAIAGLWEKDYRSWIKPALPWAFFGVGILGTGVLMGGAWAYEALSFGGFWAWDPVENSSLVPWMVLVAAAHLMLINRNKKKATALFSTVYFAILAFLLVLYSTFLTKSGILGDTSVHSFVDSGILPQLLAYLLGFIALAHTMLLGTTKRRLIHLAWTLGILCLAFFQEYALATLGFLIIQGVAAVKSFRTEFRSEEDEDSLLSREFWMFVGALLIMIAAVHITWQTSIPVFNKFLQPFSGILSSLGDTFNSNILRDLAAHNLAPGKDIERTFHLVQVPLATLIFLILGATQWLKYKSSNRRKVFSQLARSLLGAVVVTSVIAFSFNFKLHEIPRVALIFATIFGVFSNGDYIWSILKGKMDLWGSPLAHIGFSLTIFGAVISTSQQVFISENIVGDIGSLSEKLNNRTDLLLMQGDTLQMGQYFVCYTGKEEEGVHVNYAMDYYERVGNHYKEGDIIAFDTMIFEAKEDHTCSNDFATDLETFWTFIPVPTPEQVKTAENWKNGIPGEKIFTLKPSIQINERMGNSPEPDTRHSLFSDLYTHIKWGRVTPPDIDEQGWLGGRNQIFNVGDSVFIGSTLLSIDSLTVIGDEGRPTLGLLDKDLALSACISLERLGDNGLHIITQAQPLYIIRDSLIIPDVHEIDDWGLKIRFDNFNPTNEEIELTIWEHESTRKDFIVIQAIIFPLINFLWLGCILMALGSFMAVRRRLKLNRIQSK